MHDDRSFHGARQTVHTDCLMSRCARAGVMSPKMDVPETDKSPARAQPPSSGNAPDDKTINLTYRNFRFNRKIIY